MPAFRNRPSAQNTICKRPGFHRRSFSASGGSDARGRFTGLESYSGQGKTLWILGIAEPESVSSSENAEAAETRSPTALELVSGRPVQVLQGLADRVPEQPSGPVVVRMGAVRRLRDDRVDHPQLEAMGRVGLEGRCSLALLVGVAPENRGAALGRDHRVDGVFLHQHAVGHGDGDRPA
jgi:hypothetical protein